MYGAVLGASTTTTAALALPNTGSNKVLEAVVITVLIAGVVITLANVARMISAKTSA